MSEEIKIIYKDRSYLVINKPAGIVTTKEGREKDNTLEDYLFNNYPNSLPRNGVMHRLDKETSGLVLVAREKNSWINFKKQFKDRKVIKKYYCLTGGEVSIDGSINWPIGRLHHSFGRFGVTVDGKEALTEFRLIKKYLKDKKKYSLLEINLKTGRTHQIRVHLSHLRWPLVGDRVYGGETEVLKRLFLHAFWLEFEDSLGKRVCYTSELPDDLKNHLKLYEEE